MHLSHCHWLVRIGRNTAAQTALFIAVILFIANLDALVDHVLHPEIPYFDQEHIVVGGVTAFVCAILFALLLVYVRHLNRALDTIKTLEGILPICSHCKKVRKPDGNPGNPESWQSVESYVTERTSSRFSHGICPDCMVTHYGDLMRKNGAASSAEVPRPDEAPPSGFSSIAR